MTESDDNRPHAPGIQVWAVLAGLAVSAALYIGAVLLLVEPIQKAAGRSPESYMGVAFLVLAPACLFFGSILTGYLAAAWAKQPLLGGILRAPGLYIGVLWLLPGFSAGAPTPIALAIGKGYRDTQENVQECRVISCRVEHSALWVSRQPSPRRQQGRPTPPLAIKGAAPGSLRLNVR